VESRKTAATAHSKAGPKWRRTRVACMTASGEGRGRYR
jgi:hypothetical protein